MVAAPVLAEGGKYFHWGVVQISAANLAVIALMLVLFAVALVLPFPGRGKRDDAERDGAGREP